VGFRNEEERSMLRVHEFLTRRALGLCFALVAGALAAGCSTVGPDDAANATGSLDGLVRSDRGWTVPSMEILIWCEGTTQSSGIEYAATTDGSGVFSLEDIDLGEPSAYVRDYEIYLNRTRQSSAALNESYGTYSGTISIERDPSGTAEFVLPWIERDPKQPSAPMEF
jgi:hypothetical protein